MVVETCDFQEVYQQESWGSFTLGNFTGVRQTIHSKPGLEFQVTPSLAGMNLIIYEGRLHNGRKEATLGLIKVNVIKNIWTSEGERLVLKDSVPISGASTALRNAEKNSLVWWEHGHFCWSASNRRWLQYDTSGPRKLHLLLSFEKQKKQKKTASLVLFSWGILFKVPLSVLPRLHAAERYQALLLADRPLCENPA